MTPGTSGFEDVAPLTRSFANSSPPSGDALKGTGEPLNVHIYPSPIVNESRMFKITRTLARAKLFGKVVLIGTTEVGLPTIEYLEDSREIWRVAVGERHGVSTFRKAVAIGKWAFGVWAILRGKRIACINAHSLSVLPLCLALKVRHGSKLVYDTHELETETASSYGLRRVLTKAIERFAIRWVDEISTVNEAIADWYQEEYDLTRVHVVRNIPYRVAAPDRSSMLRDGLGISSSDLVFIYQGLVGPGRGIEALLAAFRQVKLDRHLVVLGYGPLVPDVRAAAGQARNIHFHPAVSPSELHIYTAGADVGLALIEDVSLSYRYCLPNKVFEYLSAGLPVVVSPLPSMRDMVHEERCGWVLDPTTPKIVDFVNSLDRQSVDQVRQFALATGARNAWENEEPALLAIYDALGMLPVA